MSSSVTLVFPFNAGRRGIADTAVTGLCLRTFRATLAFPCMHRLLQRWETRLREAAAATVSSSSAGWEAKDLGGWRWGGVARGARARGRMKKEEMSHGDQSPRRSPQITPSAGADELTRPPPAPLLLLLLLLLAPSLHSSFKTATLHVRGGKKELQMLRH